MSRYDELFAEAVPLIMGQRHRREVPPVEGGRWPVSVLSAPDPVLTGSLDSITETLIELAGPGHFQTGRAGSGHFTVRALELYREVVPDDDPALARYARALRTAANRTAAFSAMITGLTLTPTGVLACVGAGTAELHGLSDALADELGEDAWLERDHHPRTMRHVSVLHFGAAIARPAALVDWVADRRTSEIGTTMINSVDLVRFRHDRSPGRELMRPVRLIDPVPLNGTGRPSP
jgi:hypothetical protein